MFCFQCEQTANCKSCSGSAGVCGKSSVTSQAQDDLTGALISLAMSGSDDYDLFIDGLFTTVTNVNFSSETVKAITKRAKSDIFDMAKIWNADEDIRSLKSLILFGLRGMAAYAYHARVLGYRDDDVNKFFVKALTETYGAPSPVQVSTTIEKGPFIVITGHDLKDLELLLRQTEGKGINIYTHGEMLPAHAYPELRKFSHLKGNFGTAWQNQQKEFDNIPGAILFTTNCLMPVKPSYADRVFTTGVVSYPELIHIGEDKNFEPVIKKTLELGGYAEDKLMTGINGGDKVMTGFGRGTVLGVADKVIEAVKTGAIKHFLLVGGCDGARAGRNYYTEFVKKTPADSVVLTLACGKYRFNDLDLGTIGGLPRIMDMGQCNDAYSAIQVAVALADAFKCGVNDLPLSIVLSWYEQKAVCVLLTLLALGIKNIRLGPTLPAFVSKNVLNYLVENFNIAPTTTPDEDLKQLGIKN